MIPPAEKKPPKPVKKIGCTFTLLELLVVMAIIAILYAVAVPNFLEAQSRSKVSRVKADMRSMATGIEAYYVDNNAYPPNAEILWQGPVKYLSSPFADPFADYKGTPFKYVVGRPAIEKAIEAGYLPPDYPVTDNNEIWLLYSPGPDTTDDGGAIVYDPTNGTISSGDVIRVKNGGGPQHYAGYKKVKAEERVEYEGIAIPQAAPMTTPAPPQSGLSVPQAPGTTESDFIPLFTTDRAQEARPQVPEKPAPQQLGLVKQEVRFLAGLQSLSIEIPTGGIQRTMESLSKDSQVEVRFLERQSFLRICFLSWIIPLSLMVGIWVYKRSLYNRLFLIGIAVVLLLPLLKSSPWTVFFNSAFLGILCSLSAPVFSRLTRRYMNSHVSSPAILILVFTFLVVSPLGNAETTGSVALNSVELIVPYGTDKAPGSEEDPLAFISRENFALLWKDAWKEPAAPSRIDPIAARISLTGLLSSDGSHIQGTLSIYAVNPNDSPANLDLKMKQITLQSFPMDHLQAFLESTPQGLMLQMKPHWMGEINAPFILPCESRGATGGFRIEFPESAIGLWKMEFPYSGITVVEAHDAPFIKEKTTGGTALSGWTKPGLLEISWKGETGAEADISSDQEKNWRASFESRLEWTSLAFAGFSSTIKIEKKDVSGSIPEKITLIKNPSLHIISAGGADLLETRVSDTAVELTLRKTGKTEITMEGFQVVSRNTPGKDPLAVSLNAAGLSVPDGIECQSILFFDVSDRIEIVSVNTERLERRPSRELKSGFASQQYETVHPDWKAQFVFKPYMPVFETEIRELWAPMDGFLHRLCDVTLIPRNSRITQCMISLPQGLRVLNVSGNNILNWAQDKQILLIAFHNDLEQESTVRIFATSDLGKDKDLITIEPLSVSHSADTRRTAVVLVSPDDDLQDINLAEADSRAPEHKDQDLLNTIPLNIDKQAFFLRAYNLASAKPLGFRIVPVEATALYTIFNQATVSDGLQSLDAVLRVEPRKGRIRKVSALLILPSPDPQAPARLRTLGPVRDVGTTALSDRIFRVTAELTSPRSEPVDVRFQLDSPVNTENGREIGISILAPEEGTGARSLLLLRRTFEGELNLKDNTGVRVLDPAELRHPEINMIPLPSDQSFELSIKANSGPVFQIARHKREEALRAVVEILRQRTIITQDGMERCELEIVLQNKSEQFLKIALPYPKADVSVYEVLVASRPVKTTFIREDNRDALMVPLIRTGLLEPELTVSVAYVVNKREPFKGRGTREQKLPDILGGIPVAQSALVLMMPTSFKYHDFKGSLNQVQLLDIEVDEALRQAKQVEKLSEAVLYSKGDKQAKLLDNLIRYKSKASSRIKYVEQTSEAYQRQSGIAGKAAGRIEDKKEQELSVRRGVSLQQAQQAEQNIAINLDRASQMVQSQQAGIPLQPQPAPQQQEAIVPPKVLPAPITFPRIGDVFVFRQLQGTGFIRFKYSSKESTERKKDLVLLLVVFILISFLIYSGSRIFSTRRRLAGLLFIYGLVSIFFGFAMDIAIPVLGAAFILFRLSKKDRTG
jgi:prepilin-type N-terminal cleavage/methylation domain-containing protein